MLLNITLLSKYKESIYYTMKKIIIFCLAVFALATVQAQELPYSKYINFSKEEFKDNHFKYYKNTNTWVVSKCNGFNEFVNVMAIIADAEEEVRPDQNDYTILVQMGEGDSVAFVNVSFYKDETYHKLLTFLTNNCKDLIQTSSNKLTKHQATFEGYALELNMEQHIISRTSARTADYKTVKNVDESYNEYKFIIKTGVTPTSKYLDKKTNKNAKRDEKGKKKKDVEDLM